MTPAQGLDSGTDVVEVDLAQRCAVCDHNAADHDAIGRRFCEATQAHALTRGCICRDQ